MECESLLFSFCIINQKKKVDLKLFVVARADVLLVQLKLIIGHKESELDPEYLVNVLV